MRKEILLVVFIFTVSGMYAGDKVVSEENREMGSNPVNIDVTSKFEKLPINLQDIAEVEYIPLETNDEFVIDGSVDYIDDEIIICKNFTDGNIFIFNRKGKALRRINHKGQGPEEYTSIYQLIYDKPGKELYVNNFLARRILVYDLSGNFKRSFRCIKNAYYTQVECFSKDYLLCHMDDYSDYSNNPVVLISKKDGSFIKDIIIPFKKKMSLSFNIGDQYITAGSTPIIKSGDGFLLNALSSDTIYRLSKDLSKIPVITRSPSIDKMDVPVFLQTTLETKRYVFLTSIKKEFDLKTNKGYPSVDLIMDKSNNKTFKQEIYNTDYTDGKVREITMSYTNAEQIFTTIKAFRLKEDYKNKKLQGKLKEIAAKINEDDNPVVMILKFN